MLTVGIGIHSDAVLVRYIGSIKRLRYTGMGHDINIASPFEELNKDCARAREDYLAEDITY